MLIRPVRLDDHEPILELAKQAGIGMLSLPPDSDVLRQKIEHSVKSFSDTLEWEKEERFLFVMEDDSNGRLVGTTGIVAHVGLNRPFYSYKLSTIVQANRELDIYTLQQVLHMVNDYTGVSELGSLFLTPEYRRDGLGRLLSRCRYMMIAEFPHFFADTVIAEIRGVNDDKGGAPFYDNLAKNFFNMTFMQADYISATMGNQFITDLMPKYPIYVNLLPKEARDVIGKPLPESEAAMRLLAYEGFTYEGYVDLFDAGPTLQAEREKIRAVATSRASTVGEIRDKVELEHQFMISNTRLTDFTICRDNMQIEADGRVIITEATARKLKVNQGDAIRYTSA